MRYNILVDWNGTNVLDGQSSAVMAIQIAEFSITHDFILNATQTKQAVAKCHDAFQLILQGKPASVHYADETGRLDVTITPLENM